MCEKQIIRKKIVYNNKNSVYYEEIETMINYFHNYIICIGSKVDMLYLRNKKWHVHIIKYEISCKKNCEGDINGYLFVCLVVYLLICKYQYKTSMNLHKICVYIINLSICSDLSSCVCMERCYIVFHFLNLLFPYCFFIFLN